MNKIFKFENWEVKIGEEILLTLRIIYPKLSDREIARIILGSKKKEVYIPQQYKSAMELIEKNFPDKPEIEISFTSSKEEDDGKPLLNFKIIKK